MFRDLQCKVKRSRRRNNTNVYVWPFMRGAVVSRLKRLAMVRKVPGWSPTRYKVDKKAIKTAQVKSQGDSSFPTDGHKALLNKLNRTSKTNGKRTNIDN